MSIIRFASYCLVLFQPFQLLSQQFPIISSCDENNICQCDILDDIEQLDKLHTKQILDSLNNQPVLDIAFQACCYHELAVYYFYEDDLIKSLSYNKRAEQLRTKFDDGLLWRTQLNIGTIYYYELDEYKLAIEYLKKAQISNGLKENYEKINIQRIMGNCNALLGDFEKGIEYGKLSIKNKDNIDAEIINQAKNDLAANLIETKVDNHIEFAIKYSKEVIKQTKYQEYKITALNNLGGAYDGLNNFDQAFNSYKNAQKISKTDTIAYATILNNIASLTIDRNIDEVHYFAAINTLYESLRLYKQYFTSEFNYEYATPLENLGDVYTALQQFDKALFHYQKALINITNNFRTENIFQSPNPKDTTLFIYSYSDMIRVLHLKANAAFQYYQKKDSLKYLKLANKAYQTAFDFHDRLQKDISTESSRLFQAKNIVPYIENALKVAYQQQENGLDINEAAFRFMEKNKATVLLQSMNEADALQFANLPDSLLNQERDLKIAISYYERQLNDAKLYEDAIAVINELDYTLLENKEKYRRLIKNLEENYPDYYQLKYQQNQTTLKGIQNNLNRETALLEYFIGDSSIYVMTIQQDSASLHKIVKPENWSTIIYNFRKSISNQKFINSIDSAQAVYQLFTENSHTLYQLLLEKPLATIGENVKHLQIIPDGELNYIPFDLLLTSTANTNSLDYKKLPYLLKDKSVGYAYSAALLLENEHEKSNNKKDSYLGFAPIYEADEMTDLETQLVTREGNINLPFAQKSVEAMHNLFGGKAYLAKEATKSNFLSDTNTYKVLHLAMHGVVNDKNPLSSKLIFYGDSLYASELYNTKLNADLAVLSACNTGIGNIQKGEGVMSLSRAFTYSGCPSLVMSLWSVPDESTADVMQLFFKALKNGAKKDEALRSAKLNYLDYNETTSHPIYWAGFVATGNLEAIQFETGFNWWWALLIIPLFVLGFYVQSILKNKKLFG